MIEQAAPTLIAVAGPKGGVGKSFLSVNLAVALAGEGLDIILADLDLGAANLQALLGISGSGPNMADFVNRKTDLVDLIRSTETDNLRFLPGSTDVVGLANLVQWQKVKLINQLSRLDCRAVVIDLGSGSTFNVLDIYAASHLKLLVTSPEMTSILNAYGFLKSLIFRLFLKELKAAKMLHAREMVNEVIQSGTGQASRSVPDLIAQVAADDNEAAGVMTKVIEELKPDLVLNMIQNNADIKTAQALQQLTRKRLGLDLGLLGRVPFHSDVRRSVMEMKPMLLEDQPSEANRAVRGLAAKLVRRLKETC